MSLTLDGDYCLHSQGKENVFAIATKLNINCCLFFIVGTGPGKILELRRRTFERTVMFGDTCQVCIDFST